eukprot:TRINITY_DN3309_c0_g1_i2.p1 TRINITY_DN3309_c0_g1~~TRINITY_DN3309_c0_g1_i2.p1  ORF type:complete len:187 (+),score=16.44 TRINITY_DN3309_c0_g1_i2:38-562(+)
MSSPLHDLPSCSDAFLAFEPGTSTPDQPTSYVCAHNTTPPAGHVIVTDHTGILIRVLTRKRDNSTQKEGESPVRGKRHAVDPVQPLQPYQQPPHPPEEIETTRTKQTSAPSPLPSPSSCRTDMSPQGIQAMTTNQLREFLRRNSLRTSGRKEELVARINHFQTQRRNARSSEPQ